MILPSSVQAPAPAPAGLSRALFPIQTTKPATHPSGKVYFWARSQLDSWWQLDLAFRGQYLLLATFVQNFCSHPLFTTFGHKTFVDSLCSQFLFITFVHYFCSQFLLTTFVHNFCSHLLFVTFVHNFCSQLLLTTFVHNFCLQLLFTTLAQNSSGIDSKC